MEVKGWKIAAGVLAIISFMLVCAAALQENRREQATDAGQSLKSAPSFVIYRLAGTHLLRQQWPPESRVRGTYDRKKNNSLGSTDGPMGCDYILSLSPGLHWSKLKPQEVKKLFGKVSLDLKTEAGVSIGDTPQQVQSKLGKPTKDVYWGDARALLYIYDGPRHYESYCSFHRNRLRKITFRAARLDGVTKPATGCP